MISFAPCKINLGLRILSKRKDGYHNIETCFYPLPWTDIVEIVPAKKTSLTNTGIVVGGKNEDNLCWRAYMLLRDEFKLEDVAIHLHKTIPIGAGLGGGSSNAVHTLILLNKIFSLFLSDVNLRQYALRLGSDCPYFVDPLPMLGRGRGEQLESVQLSLQGNFLIVIKPAIILSTAEAYHNIVPNNTAVDIKNRVENCPLVKWKTALKNDFESNAFLTHPLIGKIKNTLYDKGALYASMTGSGSSVYGIFDKSISLQENFPSMTYWSGYL